VFEKKKFIHKYRRDPMKRVTAAFLLLLVVVSVGNAQTISPNDLDKKIIAEENSHSELMQNLEYLCDIIGPRVTESDKMKSAHEWTALLFTRILSDYSK